MVQALDVASFLALSEATFDVRSPAEFHHAALPGAASLPLFNDDERAQVGTCYKKVGRDAAVELGLRLAGPHFADMVQHARKHAGSVAKVYCWRGGMRSNSVAWLLETAGIPTVTLKGGYKAYRRYCLDGLHSINAANHPPVWVLGGMTGNGKTEILRALAQQGEQILDLELLAGHRGSSYGLVGLPPQPSNEHFENAIAQHWLKLDPMRRVWIEDESRQIGTLRIPEQLFRLMQQAPTVVIERPIEERISYLISIYGTASQQELIEATKRLQKKLGGQQTQTIIRDIEAGRLREGVLSTLVYYDKTYQHALMRGQQMVRVTQEGLSTSEWASELKKIV